MTLAQDGVHDLLQAVGLTANDTLLASKFAVIWA